MLNRYAYAALKPYRILHLLTCLCLVSLASLAWAERPRVDFTVGWQVEASNTYRPGEVIPIEGLLEGDAYPYLFQLDQDGTVRLLYPWPFDEASHDHYIWGTYGMRLVYFAAANESDTWQRFMLLLTTEKLSSAEMAQFTDANAFSSPQLPGKEWALSVADINIHPNAVWNNQWYEQSPLWPYYKTYVLKEY